MGWLSICVFRLKEQSRECSEFGLGERLAEWMMAESEAAGKLRDLLFDTQQMVYEFER